MVPTLALVLVLGGAPSEEGLAQEPPPEPEAAAPSAPPAPALERLLRVPTGAVEPLDRRGGKDRATWEAEFARAREEVQGLEERIAATQRELRDTAGGDWSFSPTGGEAMDPDVLKLRSTLRRDRQSLEAARQRLRELEVEASLSGVPEAWQRPPSKGPSESEP